MNMFALLLFGALGASLLMVALYLIQRRTRDASIVDAGWSTGIGLMALWYGVFAQGLPLHRAGMLLVACPWSFRLATHILRDRVLQPGEDGRYSALRARWGRRAPRNFFLFFQAQAALIVVFSLPLLAVAGTTAAISPALVVAGVLWGWGSIAGEALADRQLRRWRSEPGNRGRTCNTGLWRYSRHPNYFFEWLHWWAYVFMAAGGVGVWIALFGPALMLVFLYRLTGIPYTEQQALQSRGDNYREYQRTTSAFFPWPPSAG